MITDQYQTSCYRKNKKSGTILHFFAFLHPDCGKTYVIINPERAEKSGS